MNNKAIKITTLHTSISSSSHPMYSKTIFNRSKRSSINIYSLKTISVHHKLPNVVLLEAREPRLADRTSNFGNNQSLSEGDR